MPGRGEPRVIRGLAGYSPGMGLPDLLWLAGLVLAFLGMLVMVLAFLRASSSYTAGQGGASGVVFIGPIPVVFVGKSTKLALALFLAFMAFLFAITVLLLLGVIFP